MVETISLTSLRPHRPQQREEQTAMSLVDGSIPLSLPAILQGPKARFAHLQTGGSTRREEGRARKERQAEPVPISGGKRRRRRWENAQLTGNPHILKPTSRDWEVRPPSSLLPLFQPPPPSFPRSIYLSSSLPSSPSSSPFSSSQGQFSISLKGIRKSLLKLVGKERGHGGRVEDLVECLERELRSWLDAKRGDEFHSTTRVLNSTPFLHHLSTLSSSSFDLPDLPSTSTSSPSPQQVIEEEEPTLTELSRTPNALQWILPDPHARFLTHVIARYYSLPSFSKPILLPSGIESGKRVTWILKPRVNLIHHHRGGGVVESPPTTEVEIGSTEGEEETETEGGSMGEEESEKEEEEEEEEVGEEEKRRWELELEMELEMEMGLREEGEERDLSSSEEEEEEEEEEEGEEGSTMSDSIGSLPLPLDVSLPIPSRITTSNLAWEESTPRPRSPAFFPSPHVPLDSALTPRIGRPRTSNPVPSVRDSSESSIERFIPVPRVNGKGRGGGGRRKEEWKFPEKTFGDFLWGSNE